MVRRQDGSQSQPPFRQSGGLQEPRSPRLQAGRPLVVKLASGLAGGTVEKCCRGGCISRIPVDQRVKGLLEGREEWSTHAVD